MGAPSEVSVKKAISEYDRGDDQEFLEKYASGHRPRAYYLLYEGRSYPLKALWAAAHQPAIHTREFQTPDARRGFRKLGFSEFVKGSLAEQYHEGERILREIRVLSRNSQLVERAKEHHGLVCKVCGFDFARCYGERGGGYIECHHIDPLSGRDGKSAPTTIDDVTVLCANCHRMIHRRRPALTVAELVARMKSSN